MWRLSKRLGVNSRTQALRQVKLLTLDEAGALRRRRGEKVNRPAPSRARPTSTLLARLLLSALTWLLTGLLLTRVLLLLPRATRAALPRLRLSRILLLLAWVARLIAGLIRVVLT
jgi:hypothetical protein